MIITELEFDLDTDLEKVINLEHVLGSAIHFTYTGADAADGSILFSVGNEYGLTDVESAYTLSTSSNVTNSKIIQLNLVISRVKVAYSKGANSAGTGRIQIVRDKWV